MGCYTDSEAARSLPNMTTDWSAMSNLKCVNEIAPNYKYAATEYYGECHYGNELASTSVLTMGCDTACTHDAGEVCGGTSKMSLYINTAYIPPPAPAVEVPSSGTFHSIGCYSDSTELRTLSNVTTDWDGMTVEKCTAIAKDYKYAGVEYYGECHYGNSLSPITKIASGCNTPCAGNHAQLCGGTNLLNLYENSAYVPPAPPAVINPGVGSFRSLGCFTDSTNARGLELISTDWNGMTVAACATIAKDYKFMGVEYYGYVTTFHIHIFGILTVARECHYGNNLASTSVAASSGCDTPCAGRPTEICGGGDRMVVYQNDAYVPLPTATEVPSVDDWTSRGCFMDTGSPRVLTGGSNTAGDMTVQKCISFADGYRYAGVENHK